MNLEELKIKSKQDDLELSISIVKPEGDIKGIIQISHGMAEHKERYYPFMEYMANFGYISVINDHRGHGKSVKNKEDLGYFYDENAEFIVEDLHQITLYIKDQYPDKELILFGHSMGSMIVRKYIKKYDNDIDKLIICGSPSKNSLAGMALLMVEIQTFIHGGHYRSNLIQNLAFGSYNDNIEKSISPNSWICANEEVVQKYDEDELCGFVFTLNGFKNLFKVMRNIYSNKGWKLQNKELPILFIAGGQDPVIINEEKWIQSQDFLKKKGYKNISRILYDGMRHEILNEKENEKVFKDILKWIQEC